MHPDHGGMEARLVIVDGYNLILRSARLRPGEGRTLRDSRDKLVNLPKEGFYNWDPGAFFGIYHPDTFWFRN